MARETKSMTWNQAKASALDALRAAYCLEIERLAEEVRAGAKSGDKLHELFARFATPEPPWPWGTAMQASMTLHDALLVLAVSPSTEGVGELNAPPASAVECIWRDTLRLAVAKGWYRPTNSEGRDLGVEALA